MGASYYAKVVSGFLIEKRDITRQVTRYDRDTGKPYLEDEVSFSQAVIGKEEFSQEDSNTIFDNEGLDGLDLFYTTNETHAILGICLAESGDMNYEGQPVELKSASDSEALSSFSARVKLAPKTYLVPYCSY